jgi:hypothetical protein
MCGAVARRGRWAVIRATMVHKRGLKSLVSKPGNANREIGVPRFGKTPMRAVYFADGGGVTTAVNFRIMPSDLLKT